MTYIHILNFEGKMKNDHIRRRKFIQYTAAGVALVSSSSETPGDGSAPGGREDFNVTTHVEVLVVGGGTAGTIAAIQAGRAGAKTLLIERGSTAWRHDNNRWCVFPGAFRCLGVNRSSQE